MDEFHSSRSASDLDAMPEILSGSLSARSQRAKADPEWGAACADAAWEWARDADRHFRAVTEMHPTRRPLLRVEVKDTFTARSSRPASAVATSAITRARTLRC
ncbi:MAG: hypothetical protein QOF69_3098 [Solirubrobacteraceae bacterium]|jgi:hypothetical protein|nr:hypothetical protein [Solirubrobacteraceae bacterium]